MKTLKQVAELLGVTPDALRQRIKNKTMKAIKMGRDWIVDDEEVQRLVKAKKSLTPKEQ